MCSGAVLLDAIKGGLCFGLLGLPFCSTIIFLIHGYGPRLNHFFTIMYVPATYVIQNTSVVGIVSEIWNYSFYRYKRMFMCKSQLNELQSFFRALLLA